MASKKNTNMPTSDISPESSRRTKTRQALIEAARELVYERGHEKISIQDITRRAGVGTGTFYNYFQTKQDVFLAVLDDFRQTFQHNLDEARARIKDPAMRVATTLKYYFEQAQDNEAWNSFVAYSGLPGEYILHQPVDQCLKDVQAGTRAGRFKVSDPHFAEALITGMVTHVNRQITAGKLGRTAMEDTVQYILRMLGIPDLVARALVQAPLPPVAAPRRDRKPDSSVTPLANVHTFVQPQAS